MANSHVEQQIVDYILQAQKHGLNDFEIKQNLLNAGWEAGVVEESFVFAKAAETRPAMAEHAQVQANPKPVSSVVTASTPAALPQQAHKSNPQPVANPLPAATQAAVVVNQNPTLSQGPTPSGKADNTPQFNPAPAGSSRKWVIMVVVLLLLGLGGSAFGYYEYFYNRPAGVWKRVMKSAPENQKIYKTDYDISYTSNYPESFGMIGEEEEIKKGSVGVKGTAYLDKTNPSQLKASNDMSLIVKGDTDSFNFGISFLILNKILYIDMGRAQILKELLPEQDLSWIKIDFDALLDYAEENGEDISGITNPFDQLAQSNDQITASDLVKNNIIKPGTFLEKVDLNGVATYHFKNEFDKQAYLPLLIEQIDKNLAKSGGEVKALTEDYKKVIRAVVNKMQVKEFETWIGQKDFQLYKMHLVVSAPSVTDIVDSFLSEFGPLGSAQAKSRDAKRLADIRQYASALELYYNDFNGYPEGQGGVPQKISPNYFGVLPKAPEPADGNCTDYYNSYWYEPTGQSKTIDGVKVYPSYTMTFCLGLNTGGYEAGIGKLSPQGIEGNITCPTTAEKCVTQREPVSDTYDWQALISGWKFDAEVKVDVSYKDFGKTENVVAPAQSTDLLDLITETSEKVDDARRLTDIRQLASVLELYFNDENKYPDSLAQLAPDYIPQIPVAPPVTSEACTAQDNTYTYQKTGPGAYTLTFCLGNPTGGYPAGKRTLSQAGIQ